MNFCGIKRLGGVAPGGYCNPAVGERLQPVVKRQICSIHWIKIQCYKTNPSLRLWTLYSFYSTKDKRGVDSYLYYNRYHGKPNKRPIRVH